MFTAAIITTVIALACALHCHRKQADTHLQLQMILDNMIEGVVVLDHDANIVLMNRIGASLISVPGQNRPYSLVEEQFDVLTGDGNILPVSDWVSHRALRGDFVKNHRISYRRKATGETGSRIMSTAPVPGKRGRQGQVIISYRDDTERQRVDEARLRLAAIVESSGDAIVSTDTTGLVTSWNKGAEKLTGYTAAEMIGQHIKRLAVPENGNNDFHLIHRILRDEPVDPFNTVRLTKDGRHIHVAISLSAMKNAGGEIIGTSSIVRDITATRSLERQLQQSQKMEAIGQLTGGIAHDFNNLLGIVLGNLDLLEDLLSSHPPALLRTRTAQKAAARCAQLTRRLLAFSSKVQLNPVPTPLQHSIRNTLEMAIRALGPAITLSITLDDQMLPVFVDPAGFESALLNLLVNARDAMPNGGALKVLSRTLILDPHDPLVQSNRLQAGSYALVSVSDNGHGMSRETLDRVFEPFFTTKERGRGTGLGLPMVYGFAKQSRGSVIIYSEPGYGTTVSLYLPMADPAAQQSPLPALAAPRPAKTGALVLLVDDENDLLDISSAYLNKIGYQTLLAKDAAHALSLLAEIPTIDVMLTDIIMPGGVNGVELAQTVRRLRPQIKIIYTSGFPADALAQKSFALEGATLINKPYRLTDLGAAITQSLSEQTPTPAF